jgi:phenylpropionate dioxygenase-like ring-hydroxylating dioxygenase large terminal subunit
MRAESLTLLAEWDRSAPRDIRVSVRFTERIPHFSQEGGDSRQVSVPADACHAFSSAKAPWHMPCFPNFTMQTLLPRNCTFSRPDWDVLARFWYPVAFSTEVGAAPFAATLLDQRLVLYRNSAGVSCFADLCLHRGVPLSMGWVQGEDLVCKYHGFRYEPGGRCVDIPAHPGAAIPPKLCLTSYPVIEKFGLVWTCLTRDAPAIFPQVPEWDDPSYQHIFPNAILMNAAAGRQVEGFLDVTHFAWIHTETFGDRNNPVVPRYDVEVVPNGLHVEYRSTVSNYPKAMQDKATSDFTYPFSARLTVHFPGDARLVILNAASPISARKTRIFVPIARNFDQDKSLEPVYAFNHQVFAEDQEIVERQCPEDLPTDLLEEVHIRADRTSIEYRKALAALGLGRNYTA